MTQSTWARGTVSKVHGCKIQYVAWPRFPICTPGFPGGTMVKNPCASAGDVRDVDLISGSGRSPGVRKGNSLQPGKSHGQMNLADYL